MRDKAIKPSWILLDEHQLSGPEPHHKLLLHRRHIRAEIVTQRLNRAALCQGRGVAKNEPARPCVPGIARTADRLVLRTTLHLVVGDSPPQPKGAERKARGPALFF